MESSLISLCLLFIVSVHTLTQKDVTSIKTGCPETLPIVDHAKISEVYVKSNYTKGDRLLYNCQPGYVSFIKITYICDGQRWTPLRNAECSRKRCELPTDIENGYYTIVNGTAFVYETTIKYICKEGYQMSSQTDTRTCLAFGWDKHLPVCEEFLCSSPIMGDNNLTVHGLPDESDETSMRYGHRLQFSCSSPALQLVGASEIICGTNGQWTSPNPSCEEVTCQLEKIDPTVSVVGLPETNVFKYGHKLDFYCSQPGTVLKGKGKVYCSTGGNWSSPFPTCSVAICKEGPLNYVKIVRGNPSVNPPFKPGHSLMFQCVYSFTIMIGPPVITCRNDGTWSTPYPTCFVNGACPAPYIPPPAEFTTIRQDLYRHGSTVRYSCPQYYITDGNPELMCLQGQWSGYVKCYKPCILTIEDMDAHHIQQYYGKKEPMFPKHKEYVTFKCQSQKRSKPGSPKFRQMCDDGRMDLPICH